MIQRFLLGVPSSVKIGAMLISNGLLMWFFWRGLMEPERYYSWIGSQPLVIFLFEFLSIHSTAILSAEPNSMKSPSLFRTGLLFGFYALLAAIFAIFLNLWFLFVYFLISTFSKFFLTGKRMTNGAAGLLILIFFGTLFLVNWTSSFWESFFPFPDIVMNELPGGDGEIFSSPQTVLIWGLMYFSLQLIVMGVVLFNRFAD